MLQVFHRQARRNGRQWLKAASAFAATRNYSSGAGGGSLSSPIKLSSIPAPHAGEITVLSLNRPKARNAISRQLLSELKNVVEQLHREGAATSTRALILASESDDAFCAGADLKERLEFSEEEYGAVPMAVVRTAANTVFYSAPANSFKTCAAPSQLSRRFRFPRSPPLAALRLEAASSWHSAPTSE